MADPPRRWGDGNLLSLLIGECLRSRHLEAGNAAMKVPQSASSVRCELGMSFRGKPHLAGGIDRCRGIVAPTSDSVAAIMEIAAESVFGAKPLALAR
jgi:hypothetical protein